MPRGKLGEVMLKRFFIVSFICCVSFVSAKAQAYGEEGVGIAGVTVGKSSLSDVVAMYGEDYKIIEHNKYSYEARYSNGLSFWYCYADTDKRIVGLKVAPPYTGITSKGIVVGESTVEDVFRIYGESDPSSTVNKDTLGFRYNGIYFYIKYEDWEENDTAELFLQRILQRKIIKVIIEAADRKGNACGK